MWIDGAELYLLIRRAGYTAVILAATAGQILPGQNFTMDKKVIVQNTGGSGKQERVLFRLVLRVGGRAFDQQVVIRDNDRPGLSRADFLPFVLAQLTVGRKLQLGGLSSLD